MKYQKLYSHITDEYSAKILNWAIKKTGNRGDGEDLAQEVMLQVFLAVGRENHIHKLENFIWKVAHYVWCNNLRTSSKHRNSTVLEDTVGDGLDFVKELIHKDTIRSEFNRVKRKIADLSHVQREAMILYYLENLSILDVSIKLNTTESAIKWHLFNARKKIKKELEYVKKEDSYLYRPGRLMLGLSGIPGPNPDTHKVNDSLIRQNICLLCYKEPKTVDELSELSGIPRPYLEFELQWLVDHEFLSLEKKKYKTIFPIIGLKHRQFIGDLYNKTKAEYADKVIDYFLSQEDKIRNIGFYDADYKSEKLLWPLTMLFLSYFSRSSIALALKQQDNRSIRPDGGKYYIIGNDLSDKQELDPEGYFKPKGWNDFYGICSDSCETSGKYESYYWLGVYHFEAYEHHPGIIKERNTSVKRLWHSLFTSLIDPNFNVVNLSHDEQEMLALAIRDGLVTKMGTVYKPNFVIFTKEQLNTLQQEIFKPLLETLLPKTEELIRTISKIHAENIPSANKGYVNYLTYLDLWYFGIYTLIFGVEDQKLFSPPSAKEGAPLTLVLIK